MVWLLLTVASAAELVLSFPDEPVRYHGELLVDSGETLALLGRNNLNARAATITAAADFTCRAVPARRGVAMSCLVDAVTFAAEPFSELERARLDAIMVEYAELLVLEHVELRFSDTGLLQSVELDGVDKADERAREVHEALRLLMRRMFVPFEQQPPRREAEPGQGWKHRGNVATLELFSKYGTVGGTARRYELALGEDGAIFSSTERGTIGISSSGATVVTGGGTIAGGSTSSSHTDHASMSRPEAGTTVGVSPSSALYSVTGTSTAHYDDALGWWSFSESFVEGSQNQSTPRIQFTHAAWLGRIGPDGVVSRPPEP